MNAWSNEKKNTRPLVSLPPLLGRRGTINEKKNTRPLVSLPPLLGRRGTLKLS
jgi:hypothetical protein